MDPKAHPRIPLYNYILCKNGKKMLCDVHLEDKKFVSPNY